MNRRNLIHSILLIAFAITAAQVLSMPAEAQSGAATVEEKILGDWLLENAKGTAIAPMQMKRNDKGNFELVRIGGGALVVCGEYKLEGTKLIKVPKPNDAYWDMTWQYASGRLKLKKGDYKDWELNKKPWKPRPGP